MGTRESNSSPVSKTGVRHTLSHVLASDIFENSDRLKNFLTYIVEEFLAGRGDLIRGKTIAMDVYGRDPSTSGKSENIVRVDARRLRRRLMEYYATDGKNDPVRIWVDSGGYVPRMENRKESRPKRPTVWPVKPLAAATVVILAAGVVVAVFFGTQRNRTLPEPDRQTMLERQVLREKSPTALQAANLADQARGFLFPLLDFNRQSIATDMFREAIRLDPDYFGGYAGAAQTLTTLAKMTPPGPAREAKLAEAAQMSKIAMEKNPTHSWTQSAAGWVAFGLRDYQRAFELSSRAAQLSPDDGNVLDFHGMISVFSGNFEAALKASDPKRQRNTAKQRLAYRNIFAIANFHLGNFEETIASIQRAAELGNPVGAPSVMYEAAASQALGNFERASELVEELTENWPNFRPEFVVPDFYQSQIHTDQILDQLRAAGWKPNN
jgi:tetratricopeptide (TPR) repeat protein